MTEFSTSFDFISLIITIISNITTLFIYIVSFQTVVYTGHYSKEIELKLISLYNISLNWSDSFYLAAAKNVGLHGNEKKEKNELR